MNYANAMIVSMAQHWKMPVPQAGQAKLKPMMKINNI
jgi:hypothetical protein